MESAISTSPNDSFPNDKLATVPSSESKFSILKEKVYKHIVKINLIFFFLFLLIFLFSQAFLPCSSNCNDEGFGFAFFIFPVSPILILIFYGFIKVLKKYNKNKILVINSFILILLSMRELYSILQGG